MIDADFAAWVQKARDARIEHVAEALGIRVPARAEYQGPCPMCGGTDRFSINVKKQVFNCRGAEGGDAIKMVQHVNGCEFVEACAFINEEDPPRGNGGARERDPAIDRERREERKDAEIARQKQDEAELDAAIVAATAMFDGARAFAGTIAEDYLSRRGVSPAFIPTASDLRFIPNLAYWGFKDRDADELTELGAFHCMVAAIRDVVGNIIGIHRTYLGNDGGKLKPPGDMARNKAKKIYRKSAGGLIRLGDVSETLAVGEGIETTLSWNRLRVEGFFGDIDASIAAGISLGNISGGATGTMPHPTKKRATMQNGEPDMDRPGILLPSQVKRLILIGDGDSDPAETAMRLKTAGARARRAGIEVLVHQAPEGSDWNDVLLDAIKQGSAAA
jgi:hypothetical protein